MGPEHAPLQHQAGETRRRRAGHRSTARSTRARSRFPHNPIQIADAALYLSKTQPSLGITDPYELTEAQLNAAVNLLKQQRPLIKKYWALASDEIELFKNGDAVIGAAWPLQTSTLQADKAPVSDTDPQARARPAGRDTWMLSAHAKHPNCAYKWVNWVSTPKVQAEQAISFGETPVEHEGLPVHGTRSRRARASKYHANAPSAYFKQHQVLEDAGDRLRQRQERLHRLQRLAAKVDGSDRLVAPRHGGSASRHRRERQRPASACRRHCSAGRGCGPACSFRRRSRGSCSIYLGGARSCCSSRRSGASTRSRGKIVHSWTLGQLRNALQSLAPTARSPLRTIGIAARGDA